MARSDYISKNSYHLLTYPRVFNDLNNTPPFLLYFLHLRYSQCYHLFFFNDLYGLDLRLKFDHSLVHLVEKHYDCVPQLVPVSQRLSHSFGHWHPVKFFQLRKMPQNHCFVVWVPVNVVPFHS